MKMNYFYAVTFRLRGQRGLVVFALNSCTRGLRIKSRCFDVLFLVSAEPSQRNDLSQESGENKKVASLKEDLYKSVMF